MMMMWMTVLVHNIIICMKDGGREVKANQAVMTVRVKLRRHESNALLV